MTIPAPLPGTPTAVPPAETPRPSALALLAVGVVVVAALYLGRDVFVPIVLAILLSFVLAPLVGLLRRLRLGRTLSVILAVLLALGVILTLGGVIAVQVARIAGEVPRYQSTIEEKVGGLRAGTIGRVTERLRAIEQQIRQAAEETPAGEVPAQGKTEPDEVTEAEAPPPPIPVEVHQPKPGPVELARTVLGPVIYPIATLGIVLVVAIFLLMQREDLRDRLIRLVGSRDLHRTTMAMDDAATRLSRYFLTQVCLASAYAFLIGVCLWLIGVPAAVLWAIIAGLMRFVPYVGSFIAAAPPIALAAAVDPGWSMALIVLGLFVAGELLQGNVVEPLVFGRSTGLSPFAVIVAAIFWTWLWGPVGLVLATPLTVCLVVLGRHVERFEFLDILLGDRPALTPVESFYQRMLAADPDEALDHAEQLLKDRSLSAYYDEVALKGLQLAANDAQRGVLRVDQLEPMRVAVEELIRDLDAHDDVRPGAQEKADGPLALRPEEQPDDPNAVPDRAPPREQVAPAWRGEAPVLCIAGRGALDEAAAEMLAQLLRKHGLGARVAPHQAVSRANVESIDTTGVAMVCISYLEISGSPAHLRYLLKRLRQKLPNAPILVGLWPAEDVVLSDERLRAVIGADFYVSSLREAITACIRAAHLAAAEAGTHAEAAEVEPV